MAHPRLHSASTSGRVSVQRQSNSRGWLHRMFPRKRHQMGHLCDLACLLAKKVLFPDFHGNNRHKNLCFRGVQTGVQLRPFLGANFGGGLNGSTQHSARTHLALKTKAKIARKVRSAGTLPWLGSDRVQSKEIGSPGEVLPDQLIRGCCIDRLSWQG